MSPVKRHLTSVGTSVSTSVTTSVTKIAVPVVGRTVALTRQGALTLARKLQPERVLSPLTRTLMVLVGSGLIGVGVSLYLAADLGLPPYDVLLDAVSNQLGVSHGQAGWALAAGFFLIAALVGERPNRWSMLYIGTIGVAIDSLAPLVGQPTSLPGRWLFVCGGVIAIASGIAVVAHTASTGGAFELWTKAAQRRGINPTRFRTVLEVAIVVIGIALGGSFGPGTAVFALAIGGSLAMISQGLADHRAGRAARLTQSESVNRTVSGPFSDSGSELDPDWQQDLRTVETY